MFERQVLGDTYWQHQAETAPRLYASCAELAESLVRGEVLVAPLVHGAIVPIRRNGAPVRVIFPPEGVPLVPFAAGIPKTAKNPNAARLFLDWSLSEEGQTWLVERQGSFSSMKSPPALPAGFDPRQHKPWLPKIAEFRSLSEKWVAEWTAAYGPHD